MRQYRHTVTITGRGRFPFDMLRYDACYPDDPESVNQMDRGDGDEFEVKVTRITSTKQNPFTVERWISFLCKVRNHTVHPIV